MTSHMTQPLFFLQSMNETGSPKGFQIAGKPQDGTPRRDILFRVI